MVRRFRQATNRRMAVLQDEQRRTGLGERHDRKAGVGAGNPLDEEPEILECGYFQADMEPSLKHIVHQTVVQFLRSRNIIANQSHTTPVIVSLSGGVDSMVIVSVLSYLASHCHYNLLIQAVHIDYANRPESAAEATYCEHFCQDILKNVNFTCRRIDHVTRGITARDEYESISRQVRFDMYRTAVEHAIYETGAEEETIGVFLGHHRGDLRENVLSNAHKGCGPLDLSGMTAVSRNDGVTLFRPLLPLEKKYIFDYAHAFGIPYFKDTTPHWSTRGKLRNKLLPLLEEIYGEGSMNNLSELAIESDECRDLLRKVLLDPFLSQVEHKLMGIAFETQPWKEQGTFFWKFVLREALHSAGIGMFSDKSVTTFLERIQADPIRAGWLQCRKDCGVYLQQSGRVYVLYAASFPWQKSDKYKCNGCTLTIGTEHAVNVGPWRVEATVCKEGQESKRLLLNKAVPSMDDFMKGSITYYLQARSWQAKSSEIHNVKDFTVRPLIFQTFIKPTRPTAWKDSDIKIQETLPLVGVDPETAAALKDPVGCGATHLPENGNGNTEETNPVVLIKVKLELESNE